MRVETRKRDGNVRMVGGKFRHLVVRHFRTPGQLLVHGEDDAGHLARAVVVGERGPVAFGGGAEVLLRLVVGSRGLAHVLEVHVDVDGGERGSIHTVQGSEFSVLSSGYRALITLGVNASPYISSTSAARLVSTVFWFSDPLSVISRRSADGGSSISIARATNVELPVLSTASLASACFSRARTASCSSTSRTAASPFSPASVRQIDRFGKISAVT